MRIRKLMTVAALIGLLGCYGCGNSSTEVKPSSTETSVSQVASTETQETSTEIVTASEEENSGYSEQESEPEANAGESSGAGEVYSKVVMTGIEEWESVGYSIAGFMDGSLFSVEYVDEGGTQISGDFSPGTPDKIVFEFGPAGELTSAVYYGTYPDEESAARGAEACDANSYLLGDDYIGAYASGTEIMVYLDPHSARFDNVVRTYFLEGYHDPAGYTAAVEKNYESSSRDKSSLKGDNFACDSIHGFKVTWYK